VFLAYVAFVIFNRLYFTSRHYCDDCFFLYGVPFAYFNEGGFAGGGGYILSGVLGDGIVVIICGAVMAEIWGWFAKKRST
jgi:hypothetical protein